MITERNASSTVFMMFLYYRNNFRPSTLKQEAGVFQNLHSGQYTLETVSKSLRLFGAFKTRFRVDGRPKRRKVRTLHISTCEIGTIGSHCNINIFIVMIKHLILCKD